MLSRVRSIDSSGSGDPRPHDLLVGNGAAALLSNGLVGGSGLYTGGGIITGGGIVPAVENADGPGGITLIDAYAGGGCGVVTPVDKLWCNVLDVPVVLGGSCVVTPVDKNVFLWPGCQLWCNAC